MKPTSILGAALLLLCELPAQAQFSSAAPGSTKVPSLSTPASMGGFLAGNDDCAAPHRSAGTGSVSGVPFTTGTTGSTGQNEDVCLFFGTRGVASDVWFDWTAGPVSGVATLSTCGGTSVDTKLAVYPHAACPADGAAIACSDDACSLQASTGWVYTAGVTYTLQIGTFPGSSGGSGTFSIQQNTSLYCGRYDDGISDTALGLTAGGETGWIHVFNCNVGKPDTVETAYGSMTFPGSVSNGGVSQIAVYKSESGSQDPSDPSWTQIASLQTTVVNANTDILNPIAFATPLLSPGTTVMVLASARHIPGEFPAPLDSSFANPNSWVVGQTQNAGGILNTLTLTANDVPPTSTGAIGFPSTWLLRLDQTVTCIHDCDFTSVCFGNGTGTNCPCGNNSSSPEGCATRFTGDPAGIQCSPTAQLRGTRLVASGSASLSANQNPTTPGYNPLRLTAERTTTQPGLFFAGNVLIGGGAGAMFGDGLRCCGSSVRRLEIMDLPSQGAGVNCPASGTSTADLTAPAGTIQPGMSRCFQYWYRNPGARSICGSGFNLSSASFITFAP